MPFSVPLKVPPTKPRKNSLHVPLEYSQDCQLLERSTCRVLLLHCDKAQQRDKFLTAEATERAANARTAANSQIQSSRLNVDASLLFCKVPPPPPGYRCSTPAQSSRRNKIHSRRALDPSQGADVPQRTVFRESLLQAKCGFLPRPGRGKDGSQFQ